MKKSCGITREGLIKLGAKDGELEHATLFFEVFGDCFRTQTDDGLFKTENGFRNALELFRDIQSLSRKPYPFNDNEA